LRRAYGSLAEIEGAVGTAAGRELRANGTAFGLSEIGAGGMLAAGEPASATAVEGTKWLTRWWKSANRAISTMFSTAESLRRGPTVSERIGEALPSAIPGAATMPPELLGLRGRIGEMRKQEPAR
jgi:hypothetical protein